MRNTFAILNSRSIFRLAMLAAVLSLMSALPLLSGAAAPTTTAITVTNDSSLEIRHLYLSPADNDNWGPDQLNGSVIATGQSVTINAVWDQATVKVVSEDQNGCFLYQTLDATGNASWTITSNAVPDCGN
jgi:hypothetical protein